MKLFRDSLLSGLSNLKHLYLKRNNLHSVEFNHDCLGDLELLYLCENPLGSLDGAFSKLTSLKTLDLSYSTRLVMSPRIFQGLKNLVNLNLEGVKDEKFFYRIQSDSFLGLENLIVLDLKKNSIVKIDPNVFLNTPKLEKLDLSHNGLELDEHTFCHLGNLKYLNLRENCLKSLDDELFSGLKKLEMLNLSLNRISSISHGVFKNLSSLKFLTLEDNRLENFVFEVILNLNALEELVVSRDIFVSNYEEFVDFIVKKTKIKMVIFYWRRLFGQASEKIVLNVEKTRSKLVF